MTKKAPLILDLSLELLEHEDPIYILELSKKLPIDPEIVHKCI